MWYVLSSTLIAESAGHLENTAILSFEVKNNIFTGNGNLSAGLITVVILTFILMLFVALVNVKKYLILLLKSILDKFHIIVEQKKCVINCLKLILKNIFI